MIKILLFILITGGLFLVLDVKPSSFLMLVTSRKKKNLYQMRLEELAPKRKPNYIQKVMSESKNYLAMLQQRNIRIPFPVYQLIMISCSFVGFLLGSTMGNIYLTAVLSVGFYFIPLQVLRVTEIVFQNALHSELLEAMGIINDAYMSLEDLQKSIETSLKRIDDSIAYVFEEYLVDRDMLKITPKRAIDNMMRKVKHPSFREWCNVLKQCQDDRDLKYVLPSIIDRMSFVKRKMIESTTKMIDVFKNYAIIVVLAIFTVPFLQLIRQEWYEAIVGTQIGQILIAVEVGVIFLATAYVIKVNKPISMG